MTIWKYSLEIVGFQTITMKKGAQIITAQAQGDEVCLWAMVDPGEQIEARHFEIYGTGHPIETTQRTLNYVNTVQMVSGLVWHVFETKEERDGK